jgi:hypothetical protein
MKIKTDIKYENNLAKFKIKIPVAELLAMRNLGKMLVKLVRAKIPIRSGNLRKQLQYQIYKKDLSIRIGYKRKGFYGSFIEIGTKLIPKNPALVGTVEGSIEMLQAEIVKQINELGKV